MELGKKIALYRKEKGMTQDQLAKLLNISNQAISKWEANQCYPDILLLPKLADIFQVSLDALFGREQDTSMCEIPNLPWEDDGELRAVVFIGNKLAMKEKITHQQKRICEGVTFYYEGDALNVSSEFSVSCKAVAGNVSAGDSVTCGAVLGMVTAGDGVDCGDVAGNVCAGDGVQCKDIAGDVTAGDNVICGNVGGNVHAGDVVTCCNVEGNVSAGDTVTCCNVSGNVTAECVNRN